MDLRGGGSTISDEVLGAIDKNGASGVPESKVPVPAELWVQIDRTWGDVSLPESSEKGFIRIRSDLVRLWVVDGIKKKVYAQRRQHDETHKVYELLDQNNDTPFYLHHNLERHK